MRRFVAFPRRVSPANLRMAELEECLEAAGCSEVKTHLSSGYVAFDARRATATRRPRRCR